MSILYNIGGVYRDISELSHNNNGSNNIEVMYYNDGNVIRTIRKPLRNKIIFDEENRNTYSNIENVYSWNNKYWNFPNPNNSNTPLLATLRNNDYNRSGIITKSFNTENYNMICIAISTSNIDQYKNSGASITYCQLAITNNIDLNMVYSNGIDDTAIIKGAINKNQNISLTLKHKLKNMNWRLRPYGDPFIYHIRKIWLEE